jgi:hypothetical protein
MVRIWRAYTDEPFEFALADGAHTRGGLLVLTRRQQGERDAEYRVFSAEEWLRAEVSDGCGSISALLGKDPVATPARARPSLAGGSAPRSPA